MHLHPYARIVFLSRYADCRSVLHDPSFSSQLGQGVRAGSVALPTTMLSSDGAEHARLRAPARRALGPAAIRRLRPAVARSVADALDALRGRATADVLSAVAEPVTLRAMATVLDIPETDLPRVHAWLTAATPILDPLGATDTARAASAELGDYLADRVQLTAGYGLRREEAASLGALVAVGGFGPAVHLIGNGLRALLDAPEELSRLRAHPALMRTAVEELLRFDSPIAFAARVPGSDAMVGGHEVAAGQPVVCLLLAANRDPLAFAEPDRLRLDRRPNPHLGFGAGAHFCLGAPLARLEARVAFTALLARYPAIGLAVPRHELRWSHGDGLVLPRPRRPTGPPRARRVTPPRAWRARRGCRVRSRGGPRRAGWQPAAWRAPRTRGGRRSWSR